MVKNFFHRGGVPTFTVVEFQGRSKFFSQARLKRKKQRGRGEKRIRVFSLERNSSHHFDAGYKDLWQFPLFIKVYFFLRKRFPSHFLTGSS